MLRVGIIGFGGMGRVHLDRYMTLEGEGYPVKVVAICDIDESKLRSEEGAADVGATAKPKQRDLSRYGLYTDMDAMLKAEEADDRSVPSLLAGV